MVPLRARGATVASETINETSPEAGHGGTGHDVGNGVGSSRIGRGGAGPGRRCVRLGGRGGPGPGHALGAVAGGQAARRHHGRDGALLVQRRDGRAGGRGPLDGHEGSAGGRRARGRQTVRRPHLDRQPRVLRPPAGLPGRVPAGGRTARRGVGRRDGRCQGQADDQVPAGRARAHQLPAPQPGRAQACSGDRRGQCVRRVRAHGRRPDQQQRPAPPGRHPAVQGRGEPGHHPGQGRVQERPDGADPVRAADRAGPRGPGAGQPAVDQQVLRHGPGAGPQLPGMGGAARADRVRDLLPQPGAVHGRHHTG